MLCARVVRGAASSAKLVRPAAASASRPARSNGSSMPTSVGAALHQRQLVGVRRAHLQHEVGAEGVAAIDDLGAGRRIGIVGGAGGDAGAGLDPDRVALRLQFLDGFGRRGDARFVGRRLGGTPISSCLRPVSPTASARDAALQETATLGNRAPCSRPTSGRSADQHRATRSQPRRKPSVTRMPNRSLAAARHGRGDRRARSAASCSSRKRRAEGLRLNNPAGHLEAGESLAEGGVRETLEETALRVHARARWSASTCRASSGRATATTSPTCASRSPARAAPPIRRARSTTASCARCG